MAFFSSSDLRVNNKNANCFVILTCYVYSLLVEIRIIRRIVYNNFSLFCKLLPSDFLSRFPVELSSFFAIQADICNCFTMRLRNKANFVTFTLICYVIVMFFELALSMSTRIHIRKFKISSHKYVFFALIFCISKLLVN